MRWKVMTATVLAWAGLLAFLVYARILQHCAVVEPDNYETWPDFQILFGLMVWIPRLLPFLGVALLAQAFLFRTGRRPSNQGSSSIPQ